MSKASERVRVVDRMMALVSCMMGSSNKMMSLTKGEWINVHNQMDMLMHDLLEMKGRFAEEGDNLGW